MYNNKEYLHSMMSPTTTKTVRPSTITTSNTTTTTTTTTTVPTDETAAAAVIEATNTNTNTNNSKLIIRDTALHYQTTTKSTKSTNNQNKNHPQNTQNKKNELFITTFADCVLDPNCHLLYHHVGKTGGTTIEKIFYTLFPKPIPIPTPPKGSSKKILKQTSCCFSDMLNRFYQNPYDYCLQQKFSAYQVRGKQFETILLKCLDLVNSNLNSTTTTTTTDNDDDIILSTKNKNKSNKNKSNKKQRQHRFLTFSTYREPIARTISDIHQLCNKNLNRRTKQLQEVCQRCTYNTNDTVNTDGGGAVVINDKVYWNKLINNTNRIYRHLDYLNQHLLRHSQSYTRPQISQSQNHSTNTTSNNSNNNNINVDSSPIVIDYLMMDVIDIDDFLHRLDQSLVLKQQQQQQQQQSQTPKQTPSSSSSSSSNSNTKIIRIPYLNNDNNKNSGHGHVIKSNQESIKFCNFGKQIRIIADDTQTSTSTSSSTVELEIVELLQTSIDIYNNFTTNYYCSTTNEL
ncbi:hypothetical protein FRACYDRAFT_257646 [Fragilariopsis cylindrus CCMP1102]|uniref:Uncharacterized protein n=1 Tax=Fragilariopsis cylindrus CCMP1102 TaxID=635003 RepID=A0A1E7EJ06_9STRA|nr:hypothetical protein FRACYDRAFT_257646 [Fragilariopsis cylindrus CCMP1102]|eukprot:OEU05876.1 hypothetical protein FRACYDRAFT_257646 [Fragilariopsis cylindrus CCMP1102]